MSDLISRQAAIALPVMPKEHREYQTYNLDDVYEQGWFDLQKCIEELPSAQPDPEEFEWCTDCKEYDSERHCCPRFNRVIREAVEEVRHPEIIHCQDCKHYYFADNRIPQEQRYTCDLDGDRWTPDSYCSFAERREK